jgi:hypothetical protein
MSNSTSTYSFNSAVNGDYNIPLNLRLTEPLAPQVVQHLAQVGQMPPEVAVVPVGQGASAILQMALLDQLVRPNLSLFEYGSNTVVSEFGLLQWRHEVVRLNRVSKSTPYGGSGWVVLDAMGFSLNTQQRETVDQLLKLGVVEEVVDWGVNLHLNPSEVRPQLEGLLLELVRLANEYPQIRGQRVLFLPPGSGQLAVLMATVIYGVTHVWPYVIHRAKDQSGEFRVFEILDVQAFRQSAAQIRSAWEDSAGDLKVPRALLSEIIAALAAIDPALAAKVRQLL